MNKLFGLFLLALAFLAPNAAYAFACFWVGGTGTWDNSAITHWAPSTGGAATGCATSNAAPAAGDDVTFDASSGGGVVTTNATLSVQTFTMSAFTGTMEFSTNNNNITLSGNFVNTGSGTRTLNMGNGTWALSSGTGAFTQSGATNLTFNANSSTIAFTGTGGSVQRRILLGNRTYNVVSFVSGTSSANIVGPGTIGTLTISPGNLVVLSNGITVTVTTMTNITGSTTAQTLFITDNVLSGQTTISSANNWTCTWCSFGYIAFTGGGTFSATSSADFKNNSGITITAPSVGGGGGRIIGG